MTLRTPPPPVLASAHVVAYAYDLPAAHNVAKRDQQ
jgi:hypothetical protein